jgi:membrane protease subunit HflK
MDETTRLLLPLSAFAVGLFGRLHWLMLALAAAYSVSGITVIEANQVGVVLRFGAVVGSTPSTQVNPPGLLFALPSPIDEVVRVDVETVHALRIDDLHYANGEASSDLWMGEVDSDSIDPEKEGYLLTSDRNVLQARIVARYTVGDPIAYALRVQDHHAFLTHAVLAAVVEGTGRIALDDLLGGERGRLIDTATAEAQERLDAVDAGIDLVAIELEGLSPARQVMAEFDAVQSAFIGSVTATEEANRYAAETVPQAEADRATRVSEAKGNAARTLALARSRADSFENLLSTYRKNPKVVRERLYREGIERALDGGGKVAFIPAPVNGRYKEMRVTMTTRGTTK